MMDAAVCLVGLAQTQLLGATLRRAATPHSTWTSLLASPSSLWVALAAMYAVALGPAGAVVIAGLTLAAVLARRLKGVVEAQGPFPWAAFVVLAVLVLARPWVPTAWDEFVWLGKARLDSLGFGTIVASALDPAKHVIPQGYPALWPSAVAWLSLGKDSVQVHVVAATLLVLASAAAAMEVWWPRLREANVSWIGLVAAVSVPLLWVHLRLVYLDLPVGLLGLALCGHLLEATRHPARATGLLASGLAVCLVGIKDDGLAHVFAATVAAFVVARAPRLKAWRLATPFTLALLTAVVWRILTQVSGTPAQDHAGGWPLWSWVPTLVELFATHATDLTSWGLFWPVAAAFLVTRWKHIDALGVNVMLVSTLGFMAAALLVGPERVRAFAENGTLLNRLLMQLWPSAAVVVALAFARATPRASA